MQKIYFKGFNEIRAMAALAVLLHHVELYKNRMNTPSLYDTVLNPFVKYLGQNGVAIFFTLSGFLITYLLLAEKENSRDINIKNFYIRRALRIWPVYYIVVLIGFVLMPVLAEMSFFSGQTYYNSLVLQLNSKENLALFLVFFSNLAMQIYPRVAGASQSWSVSVEEQFYLVWPWVIKFTKKRLPFLLIAIILGYKLLLLFPGLIQPFVGKAFMQWYSTLSVNYLASGALAAYCCMYQKQAVQKVLELKWLNITVLLLFLIHLFIGIDEVLFGISCAYLILLSATDKGVSNKALDKIGVFSYGLYMYHPFIMYLVFSILSKMFNPIENLLMYNIVLYSMMLIFSFLISHISYKFIEKPILNMKEKFSKFRTT